MGEWTTYTDLGATPADDDTFLIYDTSAGAVKEVTYANAVSGTTELFVEMHPAVSLAGPGADDFGNGSPSLAFADTGTERSYGLASNIPDDWATFDIIGMFGDETGNAGDTVFRARTDDWAASATLALDDHGQVTVTALGSANQYQEVTLASGLTHTDGRVHAIRVEREGSDAGDTLTGDMHLVGRKVILRKAS